MTVDVIIPAYKAHKTINKAIASVAMQILKDENTIKVTVVNDAAEGYHDIVKNWTPILDIQTIDRAENGGAGQARQTGFNATDGEFVMYLDADDTLGSPFAVQTLLDIMGDADMAMGSFMEQTLAGTYLTHGENYVWLHGKMFRRETIQALDLRFNLTRYNEDAGFLSVFRNLDTKTVYTPQVTYIWVNNSTSTVRTDANAYAYEYGWYAFIENMAWAIEQLIIRDCSPSVLIQMAVEVYAKLYVQLMKSIEHFPDSEEKSIAAVQDYYRRAIRPLVKVDWIYYEHIMDELKSLTKKTTEDWIPYISFTDYLNITGFYADIKDDDENDHSTERF